MGEQITYRWACPYCDASRSSWGEGEAQTVRTRAKRALYGHVSSSTGDGHGPQHSVPEDFTPDRHIERIGE